MSEIIELEEEQENQQNALLISLKTGNLNEFKAILQRIRDKTIDINHLYGDPENQTLLDIACSSTNRATHVRLLLESGADVNRLNPTLGVAPIHLAVSCSDFDTVQLLVEYKDTDIYQENSAGKTAFQLAAIHENKNFIPLLLRRQAADIKLTKRKILNNTDNLYEIEDENTNPFSPPKMSKSYLQDGSLFPLLFQANYEAFVAKANEHNIQLEDCNLQFTYLQLACTLGLTNFVRFLLSENCDPNETTRKEPRTPIKIAAYQGYHDIVQLLLDTGIITYSRRKDYLSGKNILHSVLNGFSRWERFRKKHNLDNGDHRDHLQCLKLILNNVPDKHLGIDDRCSNGLTPLNYAIDSDNRESILLLLERGAYIGVPGWLDKPLIQYMEPATLEYFLKASMNITKSRTSSGKPSYSVNFNYNWLTCRQEYLSVEYTNETKPLLAMSEASELKPYLKHPSLLVFLDLKWHIVMRKLYYINLAFHLQFVIFFSIYLLAFKCVVLKNNDLLASSYAVTLWYIILISNNIILLKEVTQLIIYTDAHKYRYVKDYKNWIEITLIIITYILLFCEIQSNQNKGFLASAAIFLSYVELILLILSHPSMCVRIEMFKAVAFNAFAFLLSYLLLILAFAFSFYTLFKDTNANTSTNTTKTSSFNNITQAVFKTLLMSTGEYDLSDILTNDEYDISRWVVVLFIFLIPIVLFNLLNAIAVGDIQKIRKDAELVSIVARVKQITHMEETISALLSFLDRLANYCNRPVEMKFLKYYYTNYFCTTSDRKIRHNTTNYYCTIDEYDGVRSLEFVIPPFTRASIREACAKKYKKRFAAASKGERDDTHQPTVKVTQDAATPQVVCKCPESLKSALERFEEKFQIIELKLTENTKLLNQILE